MPMPLTLTMSRKQVLGILGGLSLSACLIPSLYAQTPTIQGSLPLAVGDGANVVLQDNLAYVSDENFGITGGGMFIVDVSDPAHPTLLSQTALGSKPQSSIASDIAVNDNLAFVTIHKGDNKPPFHLRDGLAVFDVSDPASPQLQSRLPFDAAVISDITVSADHNLFLSSNPTREELNIGLFNNQGLTALVGTMNIPAGASCVAIAPNGDGVVVGDIGANPQTSSLTLVDPLTQTILGSVDFTNDLPGDFDPFGVAVGTFGEGESLREFAFVSGGFNSDELAVIDITNRQAPTFATSIPTGGGLPFGISLVQNFVLTSNALSAFPNSHMGIVDVSDPENPVLAATAGPLAVIVDVSSEEQADGTIIAVAVNADGAAPGTPPGGITVIQVTP